MSARFLHVVGDAFSDFAANEDVVTISRLEALVEAGDVETGRLTVLIPGQGIPDRRLFALEQAIGKKSLGAALQVLPDAAGRAPGRITHKRMPCNVLVSDPWKVAEGAFAANLMIDDGCAEMSDHVTGQHVQGMVLIEAARQLFLAVTEKFFLPQDGGRSFYFLIDELDASFNAFVFPVKVELRYRIVDARRGRGTHGFHVNVEFWQAGTLATEVRIRFTACEAAFLRRREAARARQVGAATLEAQLPLAPEGSAKSA
jgi:hypothetical protein